MYYDDEHKKEIQKVYKHAEILPQNKYDKNKNKTSGGIIVIY